MQDEYENPIANIDLEFETLDVKEDPVTGESGWMLSGGIEGAATADAISYIGETNTDPDDARFIHKIAYTDDQTDLTVGDTVTLQVLVRDKDMVPVSGVEVTFSVEAGGGSLGSDEPVTTNNQGIAEIAFTLGKHTDASPIYILEDRQTELTQV